MERGVNMLGFELICFLRDIDYLELANKLGVTKQAISLWGKRGVIPKTRREQLSEILGVPIEILNREINKDKLEEELYKFIKE